MRCQPRAGRDVSAYLRPGTEFGTYHIRSMLGRGGMAVVYEAVDLRLDRRVALKVLPQDVVEGADFRERFLREARFAASLDHPNIVPIYEAGSVDGLLYIAMRFVRGGNLATLLQRGGPLEPDHVLAIIRPVADALDAAHGADLIHRDVKPANILLMSGPDARAGHEQVYLSDFGLTQHASALTRLTATGSIVGTMAYISPEQIRGETLDARTDLYALGCVSYECLTGRPPFVRDDPAALLWAHLGDEPPAVSSRRGEFRAADRVVARAMAKNPSDRYRSCEQFAAALAAALLPEQSSASDTRTFESVRPQDLSLAGQRGRPAGDGAREPVRTVFLVDDHEVVRRGVADLLDEDDGLTVVGQASTVAEALILVQALRPDVAVLDMRLPDGNGVELCRELRSRMPDLHCLMLTSFTDEEAMMHAILAGASGYVIKDIKGLDLVSAVRTVAAGGSLLDCRAAAALMSRIRAGAQEGGELSALTAQERTVLNLIGDGLTNRQIGERMSLAERTVRNYVSILLGKLGMQRRTQAAVLATRLRGREERP
ncbi:MAG TPA: protein kinase [Nakamurella sp.]